MQMSGAGEGSQRCGILVWGVGLRYPVRLKHLWASGIWRVILRALGVLAGKGRSLAKSTEDGNTRVGARGVTGVHAALRV